MNHEQIIVSDQLWGDLVIVDGDLFLGDELCRLLHGVGFVVAFLVLAVAFIWYEPHFLLLQDHLGLVLELLQSHMLSHIFHLYHFFVISKRLFNVLSEGVHVNRLVVVLIVYGLLVRFADASHRDQF